MADWYDISYRDTLTYVSDQNESVVFDLQGSDFFLTAAAGLSGIENDIYDSAGAGQDGATVRAARIKPRLITIEGEIRRNTRVNRSALLRVLNPKVKGRLYYSNGATNRVIDCLVKTAPIISKLQFQPFQIELYCPFPLWRDLVPASEIIAQWIPMLEFPLVSEIGVGFEFGLRSPSLIVDVHNQSTVEVGLRAQFRALSTVVNPSLTNISTGETLKLQTEMQAGDVLDVSTTYMGKQVTLTRNHIPSNAFRFVAEDSDWIQLRPGINQIRYNADSGLDWLEVTLYYDTLYLGV
jgi:hypothetical protein